MVQELATQWIQSYPCKTKTSQETQGSLQKFLEPDRKPTVIYTDNSLEFGKACEDLSWNHSREILVDDENARKLRGIYFIDPEDKEFKETIKNARKKLETSVAPAMPCKIMKNCGSGGSDKNKTKLACILEANESTRMRMGNSIPPNHEDHIAGKGENSLQQKNLVHKVIPMPQAMKIPAAKAALERNGKNGENFGVELDESQK